MLIQFSLQARSIFETFFGVPFHVITPRGDRLRGFFVLFFIHHFSGGDSLERVCCCLYSMVINFSLAGRNPSILESAKELLPPDRLLLAECSTQVPTFLSSNRVLV